MARGQTVVGLENSTSFIRAARGGVLRVTARPLTRGRRTQVWDATVTDADGAQLATGRVRLMCLDARRRSGRPDRGAWRPTPDHSVGGASMQRLAQVDALYSPDPSGQ
jgi:acyl-CoA thioesterase FadM